MWGRVAQTTDEGWRLVLEEESAGVPSESQDPKTGSPSWKRGGIVGGVELRKRAAMGGCDSMLSMGRPLERGTAGNGECERLVGEGPADMFQGEPEGSLPSGGLHESSVGDPSCWRGGRRAWTKVLTSATRSLTYLEKKGSNPTRQ